MRPWIIYKENMIITREFTEGLFASHWTVNWVNEVQTKEQGQVGHYIIWNGFIEVTSINQSDHDHIRVLDIFIFLPWGKEMVYSYRQCNLANAHHLEQFKHIVKI